jgi:hypothetical protein
MSDPHDEGPATGTSMLPMMLALFLALFFLLVLVMLTGGFILYIGLVVLGLIALGAMHYALWGRAFEQMTAGEREEAELLQRAEEQKHPTGIRRFDR